MGIDVAFSMFPDRGYRRPIRRLPIVSLSVEKATPEGDPESESPWAPSRRCWGGRALSSLSEAQPFISISSEGSKRCLFVRLFRSSAWCRSRVTFASAHPSSGSASVSARIWSAWI